MLYPVDNRLSQMVLIANNLSKNGIEPSDIHAAQRYLNYAIDCIDLKELKRYSQNVFYFILGKMAKAYKEKSISSSVLLDEEKAAFRFMLTLLLSAENTENPDFNAEEYNTICQLLPCLIQFLIYSELEKDYQFVLNLLDKYMSFLFINPRYEKIWGSFSDHLCLIFNELVWTHDKEILRKFFILIRTFPDGENKNKLITNLFVENQLVKLCVQNVEQKPRSDSEMKLLPETIKYFYMFIEKQLKNKMPNDFYTNIIEQFVCGDASKYLFSSRYNDLLNRTIKMINSLIECDQVGFNEKCGLLFTVVKVNSNLLTKHVDIATVILGQSIFDNKRTLITFVLSHYSQVRIDKLTPAESAVNDCYEMRIRNKIDPEIQIKYLRVYTASNKLFVDESFIQPILSQENRAVTEKNSGWLSFLKPKKVPEKEAIMMSQLTGGYNTFGS